MTGQDGQRALLLREGPQPLEGSEVVAEIPVHHGRAVPEHGVAGENRPVAGNPEAERVVGVARGLHHAQFEPVEHEDVALREALVAEPLAWVKGADDLTAGQLGELLRARRVVGVAVGEQHLRHLTILYGPDDTFEVHRILGTRVDDDHPVRARLGHDPGVGPVQGHRRRVGRQDAGRPVGPGAVDRVHGPHLLPPRPGEQPRGRRTGQPVHDRPAQGIRQPH